MAPVQQAECVLNGTVGAGFRMITSRSFIALVGSSRDEWFVQQADRVLNSRRRAIFDSHVDGSVGTCPREGLFSKSSPSSGRVISGEASERVQHNFGTERVAWERPG